MFTLAYVVVNQEIDHLRRIRQGGKETCGSLYVGLVGIHLVDERDPYEETASEA